MREPDPTSSRIGRGILESHLVRLTSSPRVQITRSAEIGIGREVSWA